MPTRQRLTITNNPLVREYMAHTPPLFHLPVWIDGNTEDVLAAVRNYCHKHYSLITHPLTGSIKPNQTPFKTVVIEKRDLSTYDEQSVHMAETSLAKTYELLNSKPRPRFSASITNDFAVIDFDLFKSYLETIC